MLIQIDLTIPPGGSAGPFDLYSDADGYTFPFATSVPAASLTAGYIVTLPIGAINVRVQSIGVCTNYIDIPTNCPTTTTTSTITTTSTSSTTTTTTTEAPPYEFTWNLITNTPSFIGTVNLTIEVDAVQVVNATISTTTPNQSGILTLTAGQIVTATMTNIKTGTYNFSNKIYKNGELYQPADNCTPCVNQLVTPLFSSYTMESADAIWIFEGNTSNPTTTTTTSTSSSTTTTTTSTSSTTSTTTTATPLDCELIGGTAVWNPTTTTSTTTSTPLFAGLISSTSHPTNGCSETRDLTCYISNIGGGFGFETITTSSVIYQDVEGTMPFIGNGNFYNIQVDGSSVGTSAEVDSSGNVGIEISIC